MDISSRISTFAPDMEVPSSFLNSLQDQDQDIVRKAWSGAEFLSLCLGTADKVQTLYYFNTGESGAMSTTGAGAIAKIDIAGERTVEYTYTAGQVTKVRLTDGTDVREFNYTYQANGNVATITVHKP